MDLVDDKQNYIDEQFSFDKDFNFNPEHEIREQEKSKQCQELSDIIDGIEMDEKSLVNDFEQL